MRPFWELYLELILLVLLSVVALVFLILFLKSWLAKRKRARPALPPDAEALQALEGLNRAGWIEKGEFRKYYFALSDILRGYLEGRYRIPATDRTTEEIRTPLKEMTSPEWFESLISFLLRADLVKFAELVPEKAIALNDAKLLADFVTATRPAKEGGDA